MNTLCNILVPADFSGASRNALRYAVSLASKFDATLTVAHVVPSFAAFNYAFPGDVQGFEKSAYDEARRLLPDEIPEEVRESIRTQSIVRMGDVRDELLGIVVDETIDLVVMGTHGRRGVERFFLGSTTENMLRRTPVPILTVSERGSASRTESPFAAPFKRILYAMDFSDAGASGLRYCAHLARTLNAELTLLHVVSPPDPAVMENAAVVRTHWAEQLRAVAGRSDCDGLVLSTEVDEGVPYTEILRRAERIQADLIVLNLHSKSFLERALLGSTAERVIRSSAIPVLSIPLPQAGATRPVPCIEPEAYASPRLA